MTAPAHHQDSDGAASVVPSASSSQLDYSKVQAYWKQAKPSILGPYMMDGFGFPASAGRFRFRREQDTVARALTSLPSECSVLDLGSGVGFWTEYFAHRFAHVVSVEASPVLYSSLSDRCSRYPNVTTINGDALAFEPQEKFGLVFLGGLLMYLNEQDALMLLERLAPSLEEGALILCRESTVRRRTKTLQAEYQVVYRSVETYRRIFADADFNVVSAEPNAAYICSQMGCELVKKWKSLVPEQFWCLPVIGRMAYWAFRLGYPWNTRVIPRLVAMIGGEFPCLTNHFFVLRARCPDETCRSTT
jgi:SAM-dependent methyltransferase